MEHNNILSCKNGAEFRAWLAQNSQTEKECYLILKRGKPTSPDVFYYIDAVEEALCYGWIDSTVSLINGTRMQRFSPRTKNGNWTELNKERARRLILQGRMTDLGKKVLPDLTKPYTIDEEIKKAIEKEGVSEQFFSFPPLYQRVRIYNLLFTKKNLPSSYPKTWENFVKNTKIGKMYGEWNDYGRL